MGFEIPVDVDYFEHPKTLMLIALTGNEDADIYPLRLWRWCALYAKNGFIFDGKRQIEAAAKWRGKPGKLFSALVRAGFVDTDGMTVHDFTGHIGRAIRIYEEKKRKQREKYDRDKGILPEERGKNSGSIPPTLEGRGNSGGDTEKSPPTNGSSGDGKWLPSSKLGLLLNAARGAAIIATSDRQLRTYVEGWDKKRGFEHVQTLLMSGAVNGWDVVEINKHHFSVEGTVLKEKRDAFPRF